MIAAVNGEDKIAVEIKSFLSQSNTYEFHHVLGQFNIYHFALQKQEQDRILYLAIPQSVFETFFQIPFIEEVISNFKVNILVFNSIESEIVIWKPSES